jgi:hypothetical protein
MTNYALLVSGIDFETISNSGSLEGQAATTDPIINTIDPNQSHQTSGLW